MRRESDSRIPLKFNLMSEIEVNPNPSEKYQENPPDLRQAIQMAVMFELKRLRPDMSLDEKNTAFVKWMTDQSSQRFSTIFDLPEVQKLAKTDTNLAIQKIVEIWQSQN